MTADPKGSCEWTHCPTRVGSVCCKDAAKQAPLTYDQIIKATEEIRAFAPNVRIQLARAIERAHGIT